MKSLTRGQGITVANLNKFINSLKINDDVRKELADLRAFTYVGIAEKVCNEVLKDLKKSL
jgi:hypothetical protein